jgi:hypothetical protein
LAIGNSYVQFARLPGLFREQSDPLLEVMLSSSVKFATG